MTNLSQPRSVTLMAGPVDTRVNPNRINTMAAGKPLSSFERRLIDTVPARYPGAGGVAGSRSRRGGR